MLRVGMRKIFLQQYRHKADNRCIAIVCPLLDKSGQRWILASDGLSAYDPERTFGERGYIRQTALRAMCNWLTAGWLIVDATQCGTKQRGYRGKMDYKGDPLDRIPKPPLLLAVFVWAVIIGMNVIIGVAVYFNR